MREIRGSAKNIRSLLGGSKFAIDYYQREYRWETKQVTELLEDLAEKFLESHEAGNERSSVENYGHYFLGSIIISDRDGQKFVIDGQQRLTSTTLLLIHLHRELQEPEQKGQIADLIFSQKFGKRSFNLDVPERTPCMEALFTGEGFDDSGQPESVVNILGRFQDLQDNFPDELSEAGSAAIDALRRRSSVPHAPGHRRRRASGVRRYPWAELLRRVFRVEVLVCPHCGGARRLLAAIHDPASIERLLRAKGLPQAPKVSKARAPPGDAEWWGA